MYNKNPTRILFVCTGNICRSPMAEAVFRHKITLAGLSWECDSAGTHDYHVGERPDPRTLKVCEEYGINTDGIKARQVGKRDFTDFDVIYGMDRGHVDSLLRLCPQELRAKIIPFSAADIPDPYYGGMDGFYNIFNMINGEVEFILAQLKK